MKQGASRHTTTCGKSTTISIVLLPRTASIAAEPGEEWDIACQARRGVSVWCKKRVNESKLRT